MTTSASLTRPGPGPSRAVRCRDVNGAEITKELAALFDLTLPGAALPARVVIDERQARLVQKWVPRPMGARFPHLYDLLDREIRATARLARVFRGHPYPEELPLLVAYDLDGEEPFVLLTDYRGIPVGALTPGARIEFTTSLLWALKNTAAAGIVHNAVGLPTLRRDGHAVQLTDFEQSLFAGESRRRLPDTAGPSPEQGAGVGRADVRDDVYGAGVAVRELATGGSRPRNGRLDAAELGQLLTGLLTGMLAGRAEARSDAGALLEELAADRPVSCETDLESELNPGRARFDELAAKKRPAGATPPTRRSVGWKVAAGILLMVLVVAMVLVVVAR